MPLYERTGLRATQADATPTRPQLPGPPGESWPERRGRCPSARKCSATASPAPSGSERQRSSCMALPIGLNKLCEAAEHISAEEEGARAEETPDPGKATEHCTGHGGHVRRSPIRHRSSEIIIGVTDGPYPQLRGWTRDDPAHPFHPDGPARNAGVLEPLEVIGRGSGHAVDGQRDAGRRHAGPAGI